MEHGLGGENLSSLYSGSWVIFMANVLIFLSFGWAQRRMDGRKDGRAACLRARNPSHESSFAVALCFVPGFGYLLESCGPALTGDGENVSYTLVWKPSPREICVLCVCVRVCYRASILRFCFLFFCFCSALLLALSACLPACLVKTACLPTYLPKGRYKPIRLV